MATDRQRFVNAAHRLLDSRADAEDAVQDTYVRAFDTFSDWRAPDSAWMYAVLRNIGIDRRRRLRTESLHADAGLTAESSSDSPLEVRSECEAAIRHLLSRVSPSEAAAVLLRDVFELDYHEIADMLDKSESATRQFLHRARLRARGPEAHPEAEESYFALCCRALEAREPALLMEMLLGITAQAPVYPTALGRETGARSASMLVQINGRYAVALVLDGIVLCIVPVGIQTMQSDQTV
ncbi:MAG: sigma-70 family RNA polymerase sigma factor [Steroidobacteraceae bacterium]|jgi:RNA polymerase sigma factor (sigma-70 family)